MTIVWSVSGWVVRLVEPDGDDESRVVAGAWAFAEIPSSTIRTPEVAGDGLG